MGNNGVVIKGNKDGLNILIDMSKFGGFDDILSILVSKLLKGKRFYRESTVYITTTLSDISEKDVDKLKKSPDNNHIEKVYWGEIEYYDNAYRNSSSYSTQYLFSQALLDVGIPFDYYYKGNGIKIASIEMGGSE